MVDQNVINEAIKAFKDKEYEFDTFMCAIEKILKNPKFEQYIHSIKKRIKSKKSIQRKIERKFNQDIIINKNNIFKELNDLIGVRVLLLHQQQFKFINKCIGKEVKKADWVFFEKPKVYTWDPEAKDFFKSLNLKIEQKDSFYTSVHYLVKPKLDADVCCEVQVRTLFEEIWGEVDHQLNYPQQSPSEACQEQLKVLAKFVAAGSRFIDSIFISHSKKLHQSACDASD